MKRILLVHDGQSSSYARKEVLEHSGFRVELLDNGDRCLERVESSRPDVVVLDVLLDGPNGFDVCRQIRTRFPAQELPVFINAGIYRGLPFRREAAEAGAQSYLELGSNPSELVTKLLQELESGLRQPAIGDLGAATPNLEGVH